MMFRTSGEWTNFSNCQGDSRYITPPENMSEDDVEEVVAGCYKCKVRPECSKSVLDNSDSGVWCCSVFIPEIQMGDSTRRAKEVLDQAETVRLELALRLSDEIERRIEF